MKTRVSALVPFVVFAVLGPTLGTSEADDHGFPDKAVVLYELNEQAQITATKHRIASSGLEGKARRGTPLCTEELMVHAEKLFMARQLTMKDAGRCTVVAFGNSDLDVTDRDLGIVQGTIEGQLYVVVNSKLTNLTEKGQIVYGLGDFPDPMDSDVDYVAKTPYTNRHEVVTGSKPDGRAYTGTTIDYTCNNYTSKAGGTSGEVVRRNGIGPAMQVGMSDRNGGGNGSWNSAHSTGGCSQADVVRTHGQGKFYCFAIN